MFRMIDWLTRGLIIALLIGGRRPILAIFIAQNVTTRPLALTRRRRIGRGSPPTYAEVMPTVSNAPAYAVEPRQGVAIFILDNLSGRPAGSGFNIAPA